MRSAVFDQIGREAGLALPDGTLGRRWQQLARECWPLSGPRPPFRTMRDTWTELGEQLLGQFGVRGGGALVASRNSQLHAAARPTTQVLAHLSRLARQYPLALLSDADAEYLLPSLERSPPSSPTSATTPPTSPPLPRPPRQSAQSSTLHHNPDGRKSTTIRLDGCMSPRKARRLADEIPRRPRRAGRVPPSADVRAGAAEPLARLGPPQTQVWPDGVWVVRQVPGAAATKMYRCPGCDQEIMPGTAHIVAWPAQTPGPAERRHWHNACWQRRPRRPGPRMYR